MKLVDVQNVSKIYGISDATTVALDNVSLEVKKGEFIAIMGPSGCGKSTLMHMIGLLDRPTHGEVHLEGKSMSEVSDKKRALIRRKKIGFIFQSFNLLPRLTAIDNVALPLAYSRLSTVKQLNRAEKMLKAVDLEDRQYYMPGQLSGGQIQRVSVARALINNPLLILADEPTGNLDTRSSKSVMELFKKLHRDGHTIIMVTHSADVASFAKRTIYMVDGRIESDNGSVSKSAKRSKSNKKRFENG